MRVKYWLTGAAAAFIIGTAAVGAQAAPAMPGIEAAAGEASAAQPAHSRRYHRRYGIPFVYGGIPYWGPRYWHRRHWRDYGYFYRPYYRRYWR